MASRRAQVRETSSRRSAEGGDDDAAAWLRWAAALGYAACGIVYIAIGAIAAAVAVGLEERPAGAPRVMRMIEDQPFGKLMLVALSLGFLGYAALSLSGAFRDPEGRGRSLTGLLIRAADAVTGALYVALAVAAVRIVAAPSRQGGRIVEIWAAGVLALPGGAALLGGIGLALLAAGGLLVYRARAEPFEDILDRRTLPPWLLRFLTIAARFGTLARGLILAISGVLVMRAAATRQPAQTGDIGDALSAVETTPFGAWLLGVAALGFIAYGVYQLAKVRHRRVPIR
ncbi:MAG TPA: DUF1206 domain-containing protein [Gemmatimonadaceae bacterium]|nr:DUF1206 domain-containing protein [Gemmatimonadaceae bacterium]